MWHIMGRRKKRTGKLVGMRQFGRSGSRWEGNIKEVLKEILENVNWIHLAEDSGERRTIVKALTNFSQYLLEISGSVISRRISWINEEHVGDKDQQGAHFFSLIYSNWTILYMFRTNNYSSSAGYFRARSIHYFTMQLWGVWRLTRCEWNWTRPG